MTFTSFHFFQICTNIIYYFFVILFRFNLDFICKRHKNAEIKFLVAEDTWYVEKKGKNSMIKYKKKQTNETDTSTDWNNEKKKKYRQME